MNNRLLIISKIGLPKLVLKRTDLGGSQILHGGKKQPQTELFCIFNWTRSKN